MKLKHILLTICVCLIFFSNVVAENVNINFGDKIFENILSSPDKYNGCNIKILGIINIEWESDAIYKTAYDLHNRNTEKGIYLIFNSQKEYLQYNNCYVYIEGVFNKDIKGWWGEVGPFLGSVTVTKIIPISCNISDWAIGDIKLAHEKDIIPAQMYNSDFTECIIRQDFVEFIMKLCFSDLYDSECKNIFNDVDNIYISKAYEKGIVFGDSNNNFLPYKYITREETAAIIIRAIKTERIDCESQKYIYHDDDKISFWAKDFVYQSRCFGIFEGNNNLFMPSENISKEQAIVVGLRLLKAIK